MNFKKIFFLSIACCLFGWAQAQTNQCGSITLTLAKIQDAGQGGTNYGIIKATVVESQNTANRVITFSFTGPKSSGEITIIPDSDNGTTSVYYISSLPEGTYSVTAKKYCLEEWGGQPYSSMQTKSINIPAGSGGGTDPEIPNPSATITQRNPLSNCINSGMVTFQFPTGTYPYKVKILQAPVSDLVGSTYTFQQWNSPFSIGGDWPIGNYKFSVSDKYHADFQTLNVTLSAMAVANTKLTTTIQANSQYANLNDGPYNIYQMLIDNYDTSVNAELKEYLPNYHATDTIAKYFSFKWYFSDSPTTKYPVEFKSLTEGSAVWFYMTLPSGMNYKDVMDGNKTMVIEQSFNPDVLENEYCSLNTFPNVGEETFEPITHEKILFESYFDMEKCVQALSFPKSRVVFSNDPEYALIYPITYDIYKKTGEIVSPTPWESGTYTYEQLVWADPKPFNRHFPDPGWYVIKYRDYLGNQWQQEIELIEALSPVFNITTKAVALNHRGLGSNKSILEDYVTDDDIGSRVSKNYSFTSMGVSPKGAVLVYDEVPDGFHFKKGDEIEIPEGSFSIDIADDYATGKHYQMVPGYYKITIRLNCSSYSDEFVVMPFGMDDSYFESEVVQDCDGLKLKISKAKLMLPAFQYAQHQVKTSGLGMRIKYEDDRGYTKYTSYYKFYDTAPTYIPIPTLPIVGKNKVTIQFVNATPSGNYAENYWNFRREIEIDNTLSYADPLRYDYSKSSGYMCGGIANITAMAVDGNPPYTYYLYQKTTEPSSTDTPLQTLSSVAAGTVATFTVSDANAPSKRYWVKVKDNSNCDRLFMQEIPVYTLVGTLPITKTEKLCDGDALTLNTVYVPGATYTWYKGGKVELVGGVVKTSQGASKQTSASGLGKNTFTKTILYASVDSVFHVHIQESDCSINTIHTAKIDYTPMVMVWTPLTSTSTSWDDENNWYPKNQGLPAPCTDVYIPGNSSVFPTLVPGGTNVCRDIYFMPGAQLGQPQLLDYRNAHVQLDFGKGSLDNQTTLTKEVLVSTGRDKITSEQRVQFGAASNRALQRHRWNMLSAPLGDMVTGDYAFGGFPLSYIMKFDPENGDESFIKGKWAAFDSEADLKFKPGQGYGHLYYGDSENFPYYSMDDNSLWDDVKTTNRLTASQPESVLGSSVNFGLAKSNGILHLPYFSDDYLSQAHRTHEFSGIYSTPQMSTFSFYYQAPLRDEMFLQFTGNKNTAVRTNNAYRFIPEQTTLVTKDLDFTYSAGNFTGGDFVLVGNPYMSALDFDKFYAANSTKIKPGYQIYRGTPDNGYQVITGSTGTAKIAPMQSFLIEVANGHSGTLDLSFKAADMAKTDTNAKLKSDNIESNNLVITTTNKAGEMLTIIRQFDDADDDFCNLDFSKIIDTPVMTPRPEVYTLAKTKDNTDRALAINTIQSNNVVIPIGLITSYEGEITFSISGMDQYNAKISFIDIDKNIEEDITKKGTFEYSFNHIPTKNEKGEVLAQEDRFKIRFSPQEITDIDNLYDESGISAYAYNDDLVVLTSANDTLKEILVFDIQGRLLSATTNLSSSFVKVENVLRSSGAYIIKIYTKKGTKEVKIIR